MNIYLFGKMHDKRNACLNLNNGIYILKSLFRINSLS